MRPRGSNWLAVLGVTFVLADALGGKALAQPKLAASRQDSERTHSQEAGAQNSLDATRETPPTTHELAALLKRLEESGYDLVRDGRANVASVALRSTDANNRALSLISTLDSLREVTIQGRGRPETGEWTKEGISCLAKLTNLVSLRVACLGLTPSLKPGVFEQICSLRGLKSLSLVAAYPERSEYVALTNLQNLTELRVSYATNFGDAELCLLTNLVNLRQLSIDYDDVSQKGTNVLSRMQHLTNAVVRVRTPLP